MKLSLDALKEKAGVVTSQEVLNQISGGVNSDCHPADTLELE